MSSLLIFFITAVLEAQRERIYAILSNSNNFSARICTSGEKFTSAVSYDPEVEGSLRIALEVALSDSSLLFKDCEDEGNHKISQEMLNMLSHEPQSYFAKFEDSEHQTELGNHHLIPLYQLIRGCPIRRPLRREVAFRVTRLREALKTKPEKLKQQVLLDASNFGFEELITVSSLKVDQRILGNFNQIIDWIREIGDDGLLHLLGIRRTLGSIPYAIPPTIEHLLEAARHPHTKSASTPPLSIAARARAKHAHRSSKDNFFGVCRGGTLRQNQETESILLKMITEASWINLHTFVGETKQQQVIEIRVEAGYGARWSADWIEESHGVLCPNNLKFRGFLEPHMSDGHERRWRH